MDNSEAIKEDIGSEAESQNTVALPFLNRRLLENIIYERTKRTCIPIPSDESINCYNRINRVSYLPSNSHLQIYSQLGFDDGIDCIFLKVKSNLWQDLGVATFYDKGIPHLTFLVDKRRGDYHLVECTASQCAADAIMPYIDAMEMIGWLKFPVFNERENMQPGMEHVRMCQDFGYNLQNALLLAELGVVDFVQTHISPVKRVVNNACTLKITRFDVNENCCNPNIVDLAGYQAAPIVGIGIGPNDNLGRQTKKGIIVPYSRQ